MIEFLYGSEFRPTAMVAGLGAAGVAWAEAAGAEPTRTWSALFQQPVLTAVLILTPLLAVLASWIPAMSAAGQDPAAVLREE